MGGVEDEVGEVGGVVGGQLGEIRCEWRFDVRHYEALEGLWMCDG